MSGVKRNREQTTQETRKKAKEMTPEEKRKASKTPCAGHWPPLNGFLDEDHPEVPEYTYVPTTDFEVASGAKEEFDRIAQLVVSKLKENMINNGIKESEQSNFQFINHGVDLTDAYLRKHFDGKITARCYTVGPYSHNLEVDIREEWGDDCITPLQFTLERHGVSRPQKANDPREDDHMGRRWKGEWVLKNIFTGNNVDAIFYYRNWLNVRLFKARQLFDEKIEFKM